KLFARLLFAHLCIVYYYCLHLPTLYQCHLAQFLHHVFGGFRYFRKKNDENASMSQKIIFYYFDLETTYNFLKYEI
ncbi:Uncharacterized protein TCM_008667, partial [Theobroma cacao]